METHSTYSIAFEGFSSEAKAICRGSRLGGPEFVAASCPCFGLLLWLRAGEKDSMGVAVLW